MPEDKKIHAICLLTDGFEEVEAITPIDLLRRADIEVTIAAHHGRLTVRGRCGVQVQAQTSLQQVKDHLYDALVLPGGPSTPELRDSNTVLELAKEHAASGKCIGAICAAPTILHKAGLLNDKKYTAHYTVKEMLPDMIEHESVIEDGNIITSRGAGTAIPFALALIERLVSPQKANEVASSIHYQK